MIGSFCSEISIINEGSNFHLRFPLQGVTPHRHQSECLLQGPGVTLNKAVAALGLRAYCTCYLPPRSEILVEDGGRMHGPVWAARRFHQPVADLVLEKVEEFSAVG
eukprot:6433756-Pyramimonas_sp.AAC.1